MSDDPELGSAFRVPLFHGLDRTRMENLARRAERVIYQPGDPLIEAGDHGDAAILIVAGRATEINRLSGSDRYKQLTVGALIGEMAMLVETVHHVSVIADEAIKAVRFPRTMVNEMMADDPELADHFVRRIASRLSDVANEMRAVDSGTHRRKATTTDFDDQAQPLSAHPVGSETIDAGPPQSIN